MINSRVLDQMFTAQETSPRSVDDVIAQATFADKLRLCPELFGKPFHQLGIDAQNAIALRRLQQMINSMLLNPLWREHLAQAGFSAAPQDLDEWQRLPITDRDTLDTFFMKKREGMVVPMTHGGFEVIASGGTSSGLPAETVYSQRELHDTYEIAGQFIGTFVLPGFLGCGEIKWIIMTLTDADMWSSGTMIGGVLQRTPGVNYVAGGALSENVFHHIMSFEGTKAVMGMSREIEALIPLGRSMPAADRETFRLAIYGSGIIQKKKLAELKDLYPNLEVLSYFASNQAEAIGLQLDPTGYLTSVPGLHLIEIVDADGRWVKVGEEGELLVTRLHAKEAPIIRMKLGDRMIRREPLVSDELVAERFEFAGRSSDILHIGESHHAARTVYTRLSDLLREAGFLEIDRESHEVQFQNDRNERVLCLVASVDDPEERTRQLARDFSTEQLRSYFVDALKDGLPFFDRNEKRYAALEKTAYRFGIKLVAPDSTEIHRTRVGKTPLIKDFL